MVSWRRATFVGAGWVALGLAQAALALETNDQLFGLFGVSVAVLGVLYAYFVVYQNDD